MLVRLKELELEEKENEHIQKTRKNLLIVAGCIALIGGAVWLSDLDQTFGILAVFLAFDIALFGLFYSGDKSKKTSSRSVSPADVVITADMCNCKEKNYCTVIDLFRSAGFTNVFAVPLNNLNFLTQWKNGQVNGVSINGNENYHRDDVFPKSSSVMITYHSIKPEKNGGWPL